MSIEEKVKDWLVDEGMFREKKVDDNAEFHYIIEFPNDNIMDVVKPKGKDCIIIGCATQVAQEHIDLMIASTPETRRNFLLDVQFGINKYFVDFELNVNQDLLQQFIVTDAIYEDGLTKNEFIRTIKRVFKAKLHCVLLINKKFGSITPDVKPSNENSMFV
jgi:hypothetical protein